MSAVKQFQVGTELYNAAMAPAVKQDELLSLMTTTVMERGLNAARIGAELGDQILVPMFMSMPSDTKRKVAAILMSKVVLNGTQIPVTVDAFDGRMVDYNTLLSRLLQWNLADFFTWLDSVLDGARPKTLMQNQAETP